MTMSDDKARQEELDRLRDERWGKQEDLDKEQKK